MNSSGSIAGHPMIVAVVAVLVGAGLTGGWFSYDNWRERKARENFCVVSKGDFTAFVTAVNLFSETDLGRRKNVKQLKDEFQKGAKTFLVDVLNQSTLALNRGVAGIHEAIDFYKLMLRQSQGKAFQIDVDDFLKKIRKLEKENDKNGKESHEIVNAAQEKIDNSFDEFERKSEVLRLKTDLALEKMQFLSDRLNKACS